MLDKTPEAEIFICTDEAIVHARRFRTTWQMELARYVIHGVLHLCHYNDIHPSDRRIMKREENRLLRELDRRLPLQNLQRPQNTSAAGPRARTHRRFPLSKRSRNPKMAS